MITVPDIGALLAAYDRWRATRGENIFVPREPEAPGSLLGTGSVMLSPEEKALLARKQAMDLAVNFSGAGILDAGVKEAQGALGLGEALVKRAKQRVGTTGQYVGAPPGVNSPQKLGAVVKRYLDAIERGIPGRDFYQNSSEDIWARAGHRQDIADPFTENLAALSRANRVGGNTTMSVQGHVQAVTGTPVRTGRFPSKDSAPVQAAYSNQAGYLGHKREPFSEQLSVAWAPERVGRGVNDMHEAEIMGYPPNATLGPTQHAFMDDVRARALEIANERKLGGFSDWGTGTGQAAGWTGNKIRRGEVAPGDAAKDYAYYLPRAEANATYEAFPGVGTGHLPNAPQNDFAAKLAFHNDPAGSWATSPSGRDILYTEAKLLPGADVQSVGRFRNEVNPATIARPLSVADKSGTDLAPYSRAALDAVEAHRGYFDVQNAAAWHRMLKAPEAQYSGATVAFPNGLDESTMKMIAPLFESKGYWLASAPEGLTVMAGDSGLLGKALAKDVRSIIKQNKLDARADFGKPALGYIDYSGKWNAAPGSAAALMLEKLQAAPETMALLDASPAVRAATVARNARDLNFPSWGPPRQGMTLARQIFAKEGYEGIRKAAAAGLIPAMAGLGVLGWASPDEYYQ